MFIILLVVILYYLLIIITLISISYIKISIQNIKNQNYIKINCLIFTINLDYDKFVNRIKKLGSLKDTNLKEQFKKITNANPIISDLVSQTIVKKSHIKSYVDINRDIYKMTTFYILSSYLDSYIKNKCKKVLDANYEVIKDKNRNDFDFSFIFEIRIINIFYVLIKNIKSLLKLFKGRMAHGS